VVGPSLEFVSDLMQSRADGGIANSDGNSVSFLGEFEETLIAIIYGLHGTPQCGGSIT
jgi:hypothetical protein